MLPQQFLNETAEEVVAPDETSNQTNPTGRVADVTLLAPRAAQMRRIFAEAECDLPFRRGNAFKGMLTFTDNAEEPIHRWFYYKEGYSRRLVKQVLNLYSPPPEYPAVLDPFCGAGTTLLEAQAHSYPAVGVELNPFAAFLSQVKTSWNKINPEQLARTLDNVLVKAKNTNTNLPELTTLHNTDYFPHRNAHKWFNLKDAILQRRCAPEVKNALLLALASTLEDISRLHKDGRLLRYLTRDVISPREALRCRVEEMISDLQVMADKPSGSVSVFRGDARHLEKVFNGHKPPKFGTILYSPPYLNNFDYSEIYKCELWLLGMLNSYDQWRRLRQSTFRSHPSCRFDSTSYLKDNSALREVYRLVEQAARCPNIGNGAQETLPDVLRGYFDDVAMTLQEQIKLLAPGGHIICVVGNSKHGALHISTDTLIAKTGKALGLNLVEIYVGKYRYSRKEKKHKLRESVVVFRKSDDV
ncbi:MAG: site-specific DNA-methyltransferase [Pyrinomonadaceae bacterium MAG19_C2-C3]|nr:site-specific DNA-methyltransferase [Pyrinomonadaceae bacterium MAG19_C2-C3]